MKEDKKTWAQVALETCLAFIIKFICLFFQFIYR